MKRGFTIIEIVIAMLIIGILIVPVVMFFNQTIENFTKRKPDTKTLEVLTDALNEIEALLRQSDRIGIAETEKIGFTIPKGSEKRKIIYELINGFIQRTDDFGIKYTPYYNNPNTPLNEQIYISLNFNYYDKDNNPLPSPVNPNSVYLVEIVLKGEPRENPDNIPPLEIKIMVKLRNKS